MDALNENTSLVIIANPNNPIGDWVSNKKLRELFIKTQKMGIPVLIDEAYQEFVEMDDESCLTMGFKFANVVCCRTFSKAKGAAGIRVGYMVSNKNMINIIIIGTGFGVSKATVGDIMNVKIVNDNVETPESASESDTIDAERSGDYLIYDIRHTFRDTTHEVSTNLCRLERMGRYVLR